MLANISRSLLISSLTPLLPHIDTNQPVRVAYSGKGSRISSSASPALVCIIIIIESTVVVQRKKKLVSIQQDNRVGVGMLLPFAFFPLGQ